MWDHCTAAALGFPFERVKWRELGSLSGGEQKRLALTGKRAVVCERIELTGLMRPFDLEVW